jgi:hypothetical protein
MKKCAKGTRRCSATKTCISRKKSRLATKKRCRKGSRKCANGRCYGKSKKAKFQFELLKSQF